MNQPERLLDPLDQFYLASSVPVPQARKIDGEHMPEPYRRLLVHENDMTPTLESAYGERIHLRLLNRKVEGNVLLRQVVLVLDREERPVEFGAIRIQLRHLPAEAQRLVLETRLPLGRVLQDSFTLHRSRPVAYFEVTSDALIGTALDTAEGQQLYGRQNRLLMPSGEILAEVLEILPPLPRTRNSAHDME